MLFDYPAACLEAVGQGGENDLHQVQRRHPGSVPCYRQQVPTVVSGECRCWSILHGKMGNL